MNGVPVSSAVPHTFATAFQTLQNGLVKVKTEEAADLVPCLPPGSAAELGVGHFRFDEAPMSHSESISSCSDAVAAGNESGNPSSALSNGSKVSFGSHQNLIEVTRLPPEQQACFTQAAHPSRHGMPTVQFMPDTPNPSITTQPSLASSNAATSQAPAMNVPSLSTWNIPMSSGTLPMSTSVVPNVAPNSLSHLPFQLLNTCNSMLALQGAAASMDPTAFKNPSAVCIDAQLAQLLAGQMKRKGKGGRQPATDPRLDPSIDPKKAKRILANRQSAAKSKLKQKLFVEGLKQRHTLMAFQRQSVSQEVTRLSSLCLGLEAENDVLESSIKAIANLGCQQQPAVPTMQPLPPSVPGGVEPAAVATSVALSEPAALPVSAPGVPGASPSTSCFPWNPAPTPNANPSWWLQNMWSLQQQANF